MKIERVGDRKSCVLVYGIYMMESLFVLGLILP